MKQSHQVNRKRQVGRCLLAHPEFVLFINEVGCNTSQKNDSNNGGQKFIVQNGQRSLLQASFNNFHFTILGFTNFSGDPVLAVIIIASTEITAKCIMGMQPWADIVGDPFTDIEAKLFGWKRD
jgi:hypothetical protein